MRDNESNIQYADDGTPLAATADIVLNATDNFTLRYDTEPPTIRNLVIDPSSSGYGNTIEITVTLEDPSGVDNATVNITLPDNSWQYTYLDNPTTYRWNTTFNDTWQLGVYNVTLWTNDTKGYATTINSSFTVNTSLSLDIATEADVYYPNETMKLSSPFQWWNSTWNYRVPYTTDAPLYNKTDVFATTEINFTDILKNQLGVSNTFDENSIRVIEYNPDGSLRVYNNTLSDDNQYVVPSKLTKNAGFSKTQDASGALEWTVNGTLAQNQQRYFMIYFDVEEAFGGAKPASPVAYNNPDEFLLLADTDGTIYYIEHLGGGVFGAPTLLTDLNPGFDDGIRGIAVGDFDNDGAYDFITGATFGGSYANLYLYKQTSELGFTKTWTSPGIDVDSTIMDFAVGDYNKDGYLDFAVSGDNEELLVYYNDRDGTFTLNQTIINLPSLRGKSTGDFDNNGYQDIAVADTFGAGKIYTYEGSSSNDLTENEQGTAPEDDGYCLEAGDFDNDGYDDLIYAGANGEVRFIPGDGTGNFVNLTTEVLFTTGEPTACTSFDFNRDLKRDLVTVQATSGNIRLHKGLEGERIPGLRMEWGTASNVDGSWRTINLQETYDNPVVVATPQYTSAGVPTVTRVANLTPTSFRLKLQNPGDGSAPTTRDVDYVVVEEGSWTMPDGRAIEAHITTSTTTDTATDWTPDPKSYTNTYTNPVVLGQVMSDNDPEWSVFWASDGSTNTPPTSSSLAMSKHVGADTSTARANEELGYIVIEEGHGTINGREYDTTVTPASVAGVDNGPPFNEPFSSSFATTPTVAIASESTMNGADGGWPALYGASPFTTTAIGLVVDEDQIADAERSHATEQVSVLAFGSPGSYGPISPVIDTNYDQLGTIPDTYAIDAPTRYTESYTMGAAQVKSETTTPSRALDLIGTVTRPYVTLLVQNWTGSAWNTVNDPLNMSRQAIYANSLLNLRQALEDAGNWWVDSHPEGDYRVYVEFTKPDGSILTNWDGTLLNDSYNFSISYDSSGPDLFNLVFLPDPVGYEQDVTIQVDTYDDTGVDSVWGSVRLPNGTTRSITLTNVTQSRYQSVIPFNETWAWGDYNVTIFANDTLGQPSNTTGNFSVYGKAAISLQTDRPIYYSNQSVKLSSSNIINTWETNYTYYLLMHVDYYNTTLSSWQTITTPVNETAKRTLTQDNQPLDSIWSAAGTWNTSTSPNGTYRIAVALRFQNGSYLLDDLRETLNNTFEFTVRNGTERPTFTSVSITPRTVGYQHNATLTVSAIDNTYVDAVWVQVTDPDGNDQNRTLSPQGNDTYSVTLPGGWIRGNHTLIIAANDSEGNVERTDEWYELDADIQGSLSTAENTYYQDRTVQLTQSWYDDAWHYRKEANITGLGQRQEEYVINLTLDTASLIAAGKMRSDCSDLRAVDQANDELRFYVQESPGISCGTTTTSVLVKAPYLNKEQDNIIYLYYGNPSATSASDSAGVFNYSEPRIIGYVVSSAAAADGTFETVSFRDGNNISLGEQVTLDAQEVHSEQNSRYDKETPLKAMKPAYATGDTAWSYKRAITLQEHANKTLQEYQVPLTIDTQALIASGKLNADCSDLRAGDDTYGYYDLYIEEGDRGCGGNDTLVWIKVPEMGANTSTQAYLYYGNPSATSASDLLSTFTYTSPRRVGYVVNDLSTTGNLDVLSHEEGNEIIVGTVSKTVDALQSDSFNFPPTGSPVNATGFFSPEFDAQGTDMLSPISWAGTEFMYSANRQSDEVFCMLSPFGDAWVEVYDSGVKEWNATVNSTVQCQTIQIGTASDGNPDPYPFYVNSTLPILVTFYYGTGGDALTLYPGTTQAIYGVPSGRETRATSGPQATTYDYYASDGTTALGVSIPAFFNDSGYATQSNGRGPAVRVNATAPIGAQGNADGNGGDGTILIPAEEFSPLFGSPNGGSYLSIASEAPTSCTLYSASTNTTVQSTTTSGTNGVYWGGFYTSSGAGNNLPAGGWYLSCNDSVAVIHDKEAGAYDETNLWGVKQMRQYVYPQPTYSLGAETVVQSNDAIVPASFASDEYVFVLDEGDHALDLYSPYEATTVSLYAGNDGTGWTLIGSKALAKGEAATISTGNGDNGEAYRLSATAPFYAVHHANSSAWSHSYALAAPSKDWWGVPSQGMDIGVLEAGTDITIYYSDGTSASYNGLAAGADVQITGLAADGQAAAAHVVATKPIGVTQVNDGDGEESTIFLPERELGKTYTLATAGSYVAVAATKPNTQCTLKGPSGSTITSSFTTQNPNYPSPSKWYYGTDDGAGIPAGSQLTCTNPIYAYYEKVAGGDQDKETNLWDEVQSRQYAYPAPLSVIGAEESRQAYMNTTFSRFTNALDTYNDHYLLMQVITNRTNETLDVDSYSLIVGTQTEASSADLSADDNNYHRHQESSGSLSVEYGFTTTKTDPNKFSLTIKGMFNATNDEDVRVSIYDDDAGTWKELDARITAGATEQAIRAEIIGDSLGAYVSPAGQVRFAFNDTTKGDSQDATLSLDELKLYVEDWDPVQTVINETAARTIDPSKRYDVGRIWNGLGGWNTSTNPLGNYSILAYLQDDNGEGLLDHDYGIIHSFADFSIVPDTDAPTYGALEHPSVVGYGQDPTSRSTSPTAAASTRHGPTSPSQTARCTACSYRSTRPSPPPTRSPTPTREPSTAHGNGETTTSSSKQTTREATRARRQPTNQACAAT